jgi:hypothetical protein
MHSSCAAHVKFELNCAKKSHLHEERGNMQNNVNIILTTVIIHRQNQLLARVVLPQPASAMMTFHDKGSDIVTSLLCCELAVAIALQLVPHHTQIHHTKQIDREGIEVVDFPWLLATIIREHHVMVIIAYKDILPVLVWHIHLFGRDATFLLRA